MSSTFCAPRSVTSHYTRVLYPFLSPPHPRRLHLPFYNVVKAGKGGIHLLSISISALGPDSIDKINIGLKNHSIFYFESGACQNYHILNFL